MPMCVLFGRAVNFLVGLSQLTFSFASFAGLRKLKSGCMFTAAVKRKQNRLLMLISKSTKSLMWSFNLMIYTFGCWSGFVPGNFLVTPVDSCSVSAPDWTNEPQVSCRVDLSSSALCSDSSSVFKWKPSSINTDGDRRGHAACYHTLQTHIPKCGFMCACSWFIHEAIMEDGNLMSRVNY